jgi:uncharacterized protein DUF222/HNH endonuclease
VLDLSRDPVLLTHENAEVLVLLRQAIDKLDLEFSRLAAEFDQEMYWDHEGANSGIDWIRHNCHMTSNAAADRIAVGKRADDLVESVQSMNDGDIGFAHLTVMTRTANAVGEAFDEKKLLRLAEENSPGKFHYQCLHYRHAVDPKRYAEEQAGQVHGNELHVNRQDDGSFYLVGMLDPVGGAQLRSALEPLAKPMGKDDYRTRPQRLGDAVVELAATKQNVSMQVTASVETLLGLVGAPGAESEFSLPISSKTVERWACDCNLSRVLLQDSVVIDVGRSERTIKGPRRRALIARDRHCRWPGCERPASSCDGHHVIHWMHGGETTIENQVLLCHRHHWKVHEGGWQLIKTDEGVVPIAPTVNFGIARGPD